jgi:hypothetical protein
MAINKTSKNRIVTVTENYNLMVGGKLVKTTNQFNIESAKENLTLISGKKIISQSNNK